MKRKLTIYIFLIAALSVVISSAVGVWSFHQREVEDARQTLTELLSLMDAEGGTTDVSGLLKQFSQAAPDKRLTLIAPDGTVLGDTEKDIYEDHSDRPEVEQCEGVHGDWLPPRHAPHGHQGCGSKAGPGGWLW